MDRFYAALNIAKPSSMSSLLRSNRYPDRQILIVAIMVLQASLGAEWLIDTVTTVRLESGMFMQAIGWEDVAQHLLLAMLGTLFLYRYIKPIVQRDRCNQAMLAEAQDGDALILRQEGEGIAGLDNQSRMPFVAAAAEKMLGYTPGDMDQNFAHSLTPCAKFGGRSLPVWETGQITGTAGALKDNPAHKRNDALLAGWRHLFDHTEWGVIVCNVETEQIELMNSAFARMHGYNLEELSGWSITEIFPEESGTNLFHNICSAHERGHYSWESWHVRKDGSRFPVQLDATAVKNEAGQVLYHVVNVQDITARRQAEDILRKSEARLRAQTHGMLGSWVLNVPNRTLEFSAENYRIFGLSPGVHLDLQTILKRIHPRDRAYVIGAWRSAMAGEPYDVQHRILIDGRVRWVRERIELEYAADGSLLRGIGITQDITEPHEDELLKSRQNLRELAAHHEKVREEERTRIAREIHDELGQYLTALRIDIAMLRIRFGEGNPELKHQVAAMNKTIDTTIGVVRDLATSLRPGVLDMGLVSAAEWLLSGFKERTQIPCKLHAPREHLELDEERGTAAFRILQESLTNIARYAQAAEVNVRIELVNGVLEMDIRDDGVGFDDAEARSRKTFGLMGIRERVLQFGGESRIDSRPGSGTTVQIRIPCTGETLDDPHPHWR